MWRGGLSRKTRRGPHEVPTVTKFKCSVLVVDDEPYILATLAALLSTEFEVLTADSAELAR